MIGSGGLLEVALAEAQARRQRAEGARVAEDATGDRPDPFDGASTPLPRYEPIVRRARWWERRRG
jgi:hypothetical protein